MWQIYRIKSLKKLPGGFSNFSEFIFALNAEEFEQPGVAAAENVVAQKLERRRRHDAEDDKKQDRPHFQGLDVTWL